jgi:hypothetical protein
MIEMDSDNLPRKIFEILSFIITILGTLTNVLAFIICLRKNLRKTPTFIFMAFMAISDTIALYSLNIENLSNINWFYCKIQYFINNFPLKTSAWFLVSLIFE